MNDLLPVPADNARPLVARDPVARVTAGIAVVAVFAAGWLIVLVAWGRGLFLPPFCHFLDALIADAEPFNQLLFEMAGRNDLAAQ